VNGYKGIPSLRVRLGEGVSGRIAAEGRPLIIDAVSMVDLSRIEGMPPDNLPTSQSAMGAPLQVGDEVIGVVVVSSSRPRRFTDEDLKLLLRR
jgi:putative methionine-R-sulfoxide reductase with GAF domain